MQLLELFSSLIFPRSKRENNIRILSENNWSVKREIFSKVAIINENGEQMTNNEDKKSDSGQTFIEFLILLLVLIALSFALVKGVNNGIGNRWQLLIKMVASPNSDNVILP
jgi:hypothetical protein